MEKENKFDLSMLSAQFSAIEVKNLYTFKLWTTAEMLCQMQDAADPGFAAFCQVAGSWSTVPAAPMQPGGRWLLLGSSCTECCYVEDR